LSNVQAFGQAVGQAGGTGDVRVSIARAAQATGVDFDYLLAQARLESGLNPNARAGTSSAAGLYQFLGGTWLDTVDQHGEQYGLGWASGAIDNGQISDPAMRSQIMALRHDPDAASLMAAELAKDNAEALRTTLGREPDFAELYLAHFLGSDGASKFLSAMQANPGASAADLFPKAAGANRPIFYNDGGAQRSLGEVLDLFRQKMGNAVAQSGNMPAAAFAAQYGAGPGLAAPQQTNLGPIGREFMDMASSHSQGRRSMVDTLRDTFGGAGASADSLPGNVRSAYAKLGAFGL
jgi:hypothetical protein